MPLRPRRGQSTVEWMLLVSVIVIAVVAAGYVLVGTFGASMEDLGDAAGGMYTSGNLAG